MGVVQDIRKQVKRIAKQRNLKEDRAFGYWYMEDIEGLSEEEAEIVITDGPWDGKIDALYKDEENDVLKIFQFKYTENASYVLKGIGELQTAVKNVKSEIADSKMVQIYLVSLTKSSDDLLDAQKRSLKYIKNWITRNITHNQKDLKIETYYELIDITKFLSYFDRIYGVNLTAEFKDYIRLDNAILGILDARNICKMTGREELFAFNIRKFLGMRKKSVNFQIKLSLEDDIKRKIFWQLNNGIVCICRDFKIGKGKTSSIEFFDFSIVNGAQTINTIDRFLNENPAFDEPIWVFSKIMKVDEKEIERAMELTRSSNTQTPASDIDLRSVDIQHVRIADWFNKFFDILYIYKRGQHAKRGKELVKMKELAQAYQAFWMDSPNLAFSNVGKIFSETDLYNEVFPLDKIEELQASGTPDEIKQFILERLFPYKLMMRIKEKIIPCVNETEELKWKSLVYHILWYYKVLIDTNFELKLSYLINHANNIVDATFDDIFWALKEFCDFDRDIEIPKALKSRDLIDVMKTERFKRTRGIQRAEKELSNILKGKTCTHK